MESKKEAKKIFRASPFFTAPFLFPTSDNCYYEKLNGKSKCINNEIPFDVPDSWTFARLRQLGNVVGGGTPKTSDPDCWNGGISWITPSDMSGLEKFQITVIEKGERSLSEKGLKVSAAQLVPKGAVLYSCRAPIGYAAIAGNLLATSQGIKSAVPFSGVSSEYLCFCLAALTKSITKNASGTRFKELSAAALGNIVIPVPPKEEQNRICEKIKAIFNELNGIHINLC